MCNACTLNLCRVSIAQGMQTVFHTCRFQPIRGMTGWTREGQLEEEAKALAQQTEQQPEKKKTGKRTAKAE